jgi:putative endopeptidase
MRTIRTTSYLVLLAVLVLAPVAGAADAPAKAPAPTSGGTSAAAPATTISAEVRAAMDAKADACQDFYRYACGGWLDTTKLPADQSRWGRGFTEIAERNRLVLHDILEDAAKNPGDDADKKKIGAYYSACMDEPKIEATGVAPLKPMLDEIQKVSDPASLWKTTARMSVVGATAFFRLGVTPDFKNPDLYIAFAGQGGLGLPDRDYYLKDDDKSKSTREDYRAHVARMLALVGETPDDAKKHAEQILAFETELAKVSRPRADLRDPVKTYNKIDLDGLQKLTPDLPWATYFEATGHPGIKDINVQVPEFFSGMAAAVAKTDVDVLRAYLRWNLARKTSELLPKAFVDENFAFYGQKLAGQKELQARWKRCVNATDDALGEVLGRVYVEKQFPWDSKTIALEMIGRIEGAFESNLTNLTWMDDETRGRAAGKMKALTNKIGYPDRWKDYTKLEVKAGDYFKSGLNARAFEFHRQGDKVGKPVDKKEWGMTPPTVNAYYNPLVNEMVFPAGILQRPFFDRSFPPAMNFGGIGMVMGHELTHGFDDQGRKFDPSGRLAEWWAPEVSAKFEERAKCVADQYSGYEVQPTVFLNGKLTLGENIADLGGIKEAYRAFQKWKSQQTSVESGVEGLTPDQLFFVGFAQTWCTIATPEIETQLAKTDPHSAARFRVNGPLSNFPEFATTFQCAEGTPMRPKDVCEVW